MALSCPDSGQGCGWPARLPHSSGLLGMLRLPTLALMHWALGLFSPVQLWQGPQGMCLVVSEVPA